jgi:allantoinase
MYEMVDLQITNGSLVTPQGVVQADLALKAGRIFAVGDRSQFPKAAATIDAKGLMILPGLVDDHVHFREPGLTHKEDISSGSRAAAAGGVTTVLDMPNTVPPVASAEALRSKRALIEGRSYVDVGLYGVIVQDNLPDLEALAEEGAIGFKVFMGETTGYIRCPEDGILLQAMRKAGRLGLRVGAHAENDSILQTLKAELISQGRTDPIDHLASRPAFAEQEAIGRGIVLAQAAGCKFHVFHLSTMQGLDLIERAKRRRLDVTTEALVGHLLLHDEHYEALGNQIRLNPPIRPKAHQDALWGGLRRGWIDAIATDHAPHTREEKLASSVWEAACGFIGVETALPLMLTEVNRGRMSLEAYVKLSAENPARIWGLYPRKGTLQVGADADLVLVDMKAEAVIEAARLHNKNTLTPYEGWRVQGLPRYTILRSEVIMAEGELLEPPRGQFLRKHR